MGFRTCTSIVLLGFILTSCGGGGGGGGNDDSDSDIITTSSTTATGSTAIQPVQSGAGASCTTELSTIFDELLIETNRVRGENNLSALRLSQKLGQAAQGHAEDMANNNYFSHDSPDGTSTIASRVTATAYRFSLAGENLAAGYDSAIDVVTGWLNSPGHRANLLNPDYTDVGFGLFFDASPGVGPNEADFSNYWVQNFGRPTDSNTDVEAHYIPHPPENCNIGTLTSTGNAVLNGTITADGPANSPTNPEVQFSFSSGTEDLSADIDVQLSFSKETEDLLADIDIQPSFLGVTKDSALLANHGHKSASTPEPAVMLGLLSGSLGILFSRRNRVLQK